jgi:cell division protease FtsH
MVTKYGMSALGPIAFEGTGGRLIGGGVSEDRGFSPQVAKQIDDEVTKIIEAGMQKAREILSQYRGALDAISKRLVEVETLERPEYEALLKEAGVPINDAFKKQYALEEKVGDPTKALA